MPEPPKSQLPNLVKLVSSLLLAAADIASLLAQFMPMKAVFLLAGEEIPPFFPRFLIESGPVFTSLALIVAAIGLAASGRAIESIVWRLGSVDSKTDLENRFVLVTPEVSERASLSTRQLSNLIILGAIGLVSMAVSPTMTSLIMLWVIASAVGLAGLVRKSQGRPPYPNRLAEFLARLRNWIKSSAIWSVVGAAIITLLIYPPELGITGILLLAVLLRRFQETSMAVLEVLSIKTGSARESFSVNNGPQLLATAPFDFLATRRGQGLLPSSLRAHGLETENWKVVGCPDNSQVTLLAKEAESGRLVLCRVFASHKSGLLENEMRFRSNQIAFPRIPFREVSLSEIAGMPSLLIRFENSIEFGEISQPDRQTAVNWQVTWELMCVKSQELQSELEVLPVEDIFAEVRAKLQTFAVMSRGQAPQIIAVLAAVERLHALYSGGPRVIHFGRPIPSSELLSLDRGFYEPINTSLWGVGYVGTHWGASGHFLKALKQAAKDDPVALALLPEASIRHQTQSLRRAISRRHLPLVEAESVRLLRLVERFEESGDGD